MSKHNNRIHITRCFLFKNFNAKLTKPIKNTLEIRKWFKL